MHSGQSAFETHDKSFGSVVGEAAELIKVIDTDAHEGPVYISGEDALYFTSVPRRLSDREAPKVAIKRVALDGYRFPLEPDRVEVFTQDANAANGMALDPFGDLVVCEQGGPTHAARISRLHLESRRAETIIGDWDGLPLNSPNDVVVRSDRSVWFTDPTYGFLQGFRPKPQVGDYVYHYDPSKKRLSVVADSFDKPNGLAFSPDEGVLYITDSGANQEPSSFHPGRPHHILAFDVVGGRHLTGGRLFAVTNPGWPDGIKTDSQGRVYASSGGGVDVFEATGDFIGRIVLPGAVNFAWGGAARDVLFITTDTAIWAAVLNTKGA